MKKKYFVLWSGGIDSTYLIYRLLNDGYNVDAGYVRIKNNSTKSKIEKLAIKEMLPYFKKNVNFNYLGDVLDVFLPNSGFKYGHSSLFLQLPFFMTVAWSVMAHYDYIALGYIMNDDIISFKDEVHNVYKAIQNNLVIDNAKKCKLVWPLMKISKRDIIDSLPGYLLKYCVFCENPTLAYVNKKITHIPCGSCTPCVRYSPLRDRINDVIRVVDSQKLIIKDIENDGIKS